MRHAPSWNRAPIPIRHAVYLASASQSIDDDWAASTRIYEAIGCEENENLAS